MMRRMPVLLAIALMLVAFAAVSTGCAPAAKEPSPAIARGFAQGLADMAKATMNGMQSEVQRIDGELAAVETRQMKLEQVAAPALQWVELTKSQVNAEGLGGKWVISVVQDLPKLRNEQYRVAKLQVTTEMLSGGMKYEPEIVIDDVNTGAIASYEELRDDLQRKAAALVQQRQARVNAFTLVRSTIIDVLNQAKSWKIAAVDSATYKFTGAGLGWNNGLTSGEWLYYADGGKLSPVNADAANLERLLKGK